MHGESRQALYEAVCYMQRNELWQRGDKAPASEPKPAAPVAPAEPVA